MIWDLNMEPGNGYKYRQEAENENKSKLMGSIYINYPEK